MRPLEERPGQSQEACGCRGTPATSSARFLWDGHDSFTHRPAAPMVKLARAGVLRAATVRPPAIHGGGPIQGLPGSRLRPQPVTPRVYPRWGIPAASGPRSFRAPNSLFTSPRRARPRGHPHPYLPLGGRKHDGRCRSDDDVPSTLDRKRRHVLAASLAATAAFAATVHSLYTRSLGSGRRDRAGPEPAAASGRA